MQARSASATSRPHHATVSATSRSSASGLRADSSTGYRPDGATRASSAHPSTTRCAFVPLNPNELTAARRNPVHARAATGTSAPASLICGFSVANPTLGGTTPARIASSTLISPATPAAASVCPTFVFTDPMAGAAPGPSASISAFTSMGSPSGVPVPCAST